MTMRNTGFAFALAAILPAALASGALADPAADENRGAANAEVSPLPLRWVPSWLMESLSKAIADATDPRERSSQQ